VERLEEEVKQVRFASANESLRAFLAKATATAKEPDADAESMVPSLEPLLATFLKALAPQEKEKAERSLLISFGTEMTQALGQPDFAFTESPQSWLLLCSFLALHRVGELTAGEPAQIVDAFGLMRPVVEALALLPAAPDEKSQPLSPPEWSDFLLILLKGESLLTKCHQLGAVEGCRAFFADPAAAAFLLLHESDGVDWFNKERFELLLCWLSRLPLTGVIPRPESEVEACQKRVCGQLVDTAAAAGYRLDHFLQLLAGEESI